jgi:hypothetical protein
LNLLHPFDHKQPWRPTTTLRETGRWQLSVHAEIPISAVCVQKTKNHCLLYKLLSTNARII